MDIRPSMHGVRTAKDEKDAVLASTTGVNAKFGCIVLYVTILVITVTVLCNMMALSILNLPMGEDRSLDRSFLFRRRNRLELDAFGRPSESQLRREVLRHLNEANYSFHSNEYQSQPPTIPPHHALSSNATHAALPSHNGTASIIQLSISEGSSMMDESIKSSSRSPASSSEDSSSPQFSGVDHAVQSLTLPLDLNRNRRLGKRIGCKWVRGPDALELELKEESDIQLQRPQDEYKTVRNGVTKTNRQRRQQHKEHRDPHIVWHHQYGETKGWGQDR